MVHAEGGGLGGQGHRQRDGALRLAAVGAMQEAPRNIQDLRKPFKALLSKGTIFKPQKIQQKNPTKNPIIMENPSGNPTENPIENPTENQIDSNGKYN